MTVLDSRRLTGPTLVLDRPGAVLDVQLEEPELGRAIAAWRRVARRLLDAVGWTGEVLGVRRFRGGVSLALSAPVDVLYAATELNERAWEAALVEAGGGEPVDLGKSAAVFRQQIAAEGNPPLVALHTAARERGLTFLSDEDGVSVGSGTGVLVWPPGALPGPDQVDWGRVHDVPIVLVTGSNGKTTVVRLLAAMARAAGRIPGITSTDGVVVAGTTLATGDFSGPSGTRMLLRHRDVELAILETARGGLLRRGLTVERARAAVVTNVADDHLGEFGVDDLQGLAATKLLVSRAVEADGAVVLNADDALLRAGAREIQSPVAWFSLNPENPEVLDANGNAPRAVLEQGSLVLREGGSRTVVVSVEYLPIAMGGAARHNIANALAAMAAASLLRITPSEMRQALRTFGVSGADNPGRGAVLEIGGVRVIVDFAHNPHGMAALIEASRTQAGARRLLLVGQAGDRGDEAIRDLARAAMAFRPDRVVVKELDAYLRGRQPGEVPALLADEFSRLGMPASAISSPGSELAAVRDALAWARPGDLLLLTVHQDLPAVLALFEALRTANWRAGNPLP